LLFCHFVDAWKGYLRAKPAFKTMLRF
jgi:hypothetical protein